VEQFAFGKTEDVKRPLFLLNYKFPINESDDKLAFGIGKLDFEGDKLAFEAELTREDKTFNKVWFKNKKIEGVDLAMYTMFQI